jgi:hypothetical protein
MLAETFNDLFVSQRSRHSESLRAGRSGDRIPVEVRFSVPVQAGPGSNPASYTMGTGCLSRGVKRPGRSTDHPPQFIAKVTEWVALYLYSPFGPTWPVLGWNLPFNFFCVSECVKWKMTMTKCQPTLTTKFTSGHWSVSIYIAGPVSYQPITVCHRFTVWQTLVNTE